MVGIGPGTAGAVDSVKLIELAEGVDAASESGFAENDIGGFG